MTPPPPAAKAPGQARAFSLRALVVDDNEFASEIARRILESAGVLVETACSGPLALEIAMSARFDVIILDIHMPGMCGTEVLSSIRGTVGPNRDTAAVALTAMSAERSLRTLPQLGFDALLTKPAEPRALLSTVWALVGERLEARPAQRRDPP